MRGLSYDDGDLSQVGDLGILFDDLVDDMVSLSIS